MAVRRHYDDSYGKWEARFPLIVTYVFLIAGGGCDDDAFRLDGIHVYQTGPRDLRRYDSMDPYRA